MSGNEAARALWVFGYGSLMWQPGFAYEEARKARLNGYHRAFCISSIHYRGTRERPGLVLGLARGGTCDGVAFRVADTDAARVRTYLHARELIYGVYREAVLPADLLGEGAGERIEVLTYIAEPGHPSFAGVVPLAACASIIRSARGRSGSNLAYLVATIAKLSDLGIRQADLERLAVLAGVGGGFARTASTRLIEGRARTMAARPGASLSSVGIDRRHAFAYRRHLRF